MIHKQYLRKYCSLSQSKIEQLFKSRPRNLCTGKYIAVTVNLANNTKIDIIIITKNRK